MDAKVMGIEINDWLDIAGRVELARWAENRGFDAAYVAEITNPDAFVTCALVAGATSRIRIGTAIVQIGPRTAPMLASGAAAVDSCGPGRFTLGLGVSSQAIITGWHGLSYDEPLVRARETVLAVRKILAGERTREEGSQVRSKGFKLAFPPATPPQIHLAALNKGMLRLAGGIADGVWLNFVPFHAVGAAVQQIELGAAAAGRPMPEVLLSITCDVTDDRAQSVAKMRDILTFYVSSPAYRAAFAWHGYEKEMEAAAAAFAVRDRAGVAAAISDELVDSITLIGTSEHVRERLQEYIDAGVTSPNVCALDASRLEVSLDAVLEMKG